MMKVYCINSKHAIPQEILSYFKTLIDDSKLTKIKRYKNDKDYKNALIADILVRFSILESSKVSYIKKPFLFTNFGKPYLPTEFNLHFNVSHSGDWVVCAIDEKTIGIDVQLIEEIDVLDIAKDFFTSKEYYLISDTNSNNRKETFYDIWTLKESYIKALGEGLSIDLDSFSITKANNTIYYETEIQHEQCYFKQYNIDGSYKLSVCSFNNQFPIGVTYLDINDLYNSLINHI